jgi:hypothetical protein
MVMYLGANMRCERVQDMCFVSGGDTVFLCVAFQAFIVFKNPGERK